MENSGSKKINRNTKWNILAGILRVPIFLFPGDSSFLNWLRKSKPALKGLKTRYSKIFFYMETSFKFLLLGGFFNLYRDKILIGHFLSIELVTFYELGAKIPMLIQILPSILSGPLIPASAELTTANDKKSLVAAK